MKMPVHPVCVAPLLVALLGCGADAKTELKLVEIQQRLQTISLMQERQERQFQSQREFESEMREGLTIALCRPEIRQLLDDVQRECRAPTRPDDATGTCNTKKIHPAVVSADPEHQGHFLKFMTLLRHEVLYMIAGKTTPTSARRSRLNRLARQTMLKNTRFLVVAHPVAGEPDAEAEAMRRAESIVAILRDLQVDEGRIMRWIYAFPVRKTDITYPADRPNPGESQDLTRSVWVFRADC